MHNNTKNKKLRFIINLTLDSRKGKKPPSSTHQADIHFPCPQAIYQDIDTSVGLTIELGTPRSANPKDGEISLIGLDWSGGS